MGKGDEEGERTGRVCGEGEGREGEGTSEVRAGGPVEDEGRGGEEADVIDRG